MHKYANSLQALFLINEFLEFSHISFINNVIPSFSKTFLISPCPILLINNASISYIIVCNISLFLYVFIAFTIILKIPKSTNKLCLSDDIIYHFANIS